MNELEISTVGSHRTNLLYNLFVREFKSFSDRREIRILLFTHRQADPDALCAAGGLSLILSQLFPDLIFEKTIVAPQGPSVLGKRVCENLGIKFQDNVDDKIIENSDLMVVLDTGDQSLLQPFSDKVRKSESRKILIDHHGTSITRNGWADFDELIVQSEATSTCEIVALGFPSRALTKGSAVILLTGLMFDSQHLGLASDSTLEAALQLVRAGAEIEEAKRILRYKADRSELLARIKSAQRLQYQEIGKHLVLITEVSSFQASVARMLLEIGGDVGIAYGENDGETRLSVRSSQSFFKETGVDLAKEIQEIASSWGIVGGGHSTAASLSGKGDPEKISTQVIERLKFRLP